MSPLPMITTEGIIVIRGRPGSGKTTLGKALTQRLCGAHIEQDTFWYREGHRWQYEHARRHEAVAWEEGEVNVLLDLGDIPWVVVTNNCCTQECVERYRTLAEIRKMQLHLFETTGTFEPQHWHPDRGSLQRYNEHWEVLPEAICLPPALSAQTADQHAIIAQHILPIIHPD